MVRWYLVLRVGKCGIMVITTIAKHETNESHRNYFRIKMSVAMAATSLRFDVSFEREKDRKWT